MLQEQFQTASGTGLVQYIVCHPYNACALMVLLYVIYCLVQCLIIAFGTELRSIPGPAAAQFSSLYRQWAISKGDAPDWYRNLHKRYGRIVRTGPKTVDISDPSAVPIIYGINSGFLKSPFYDAFSPFFEGKTMASMFSVRDPAQHQALRRPVAQKFSMSSIKFMEPFADDCSDIFIKAMRDMEGQSVDLGSWLQWYAFDVIGSITFQRRFGFMEQGKDVFGMIEAIEGGLKYGAIAGQVPATHHWLMGNRWFSKLVAAQPFLDIPDPLRTIVKYTQECIDDYDKCSASDRSERPDFLSWLRSEEEKGKPISHRDMVNHLSNNLLAGSDTTGISLRAIIYFLVKNPATYRRLQDEVDDADKAGKLSQNVTYAECLELTYLQAVMKEAMRCHPGVSFPLERLVPQGGITICGAHLEEGTVVGVNPAVIHRDTSIFGEDADQFRPDRWIQSDEEHVKSMDKYLMTFGYGSRSCIGKNISIMEMGKLIPQIIRNFDIHWASPDTGWHVETFWFAKQHGLICRLTARTRKV